MERVLKAERVAVWPRRRISAAEWQAGERAEAIVADARAEAAALRRDGERESARAREVAAGEGRAEGLAQAAAVLLRAEARRDALLAGAEAEVVELALEVARRLLGRSLALEPAEVRSAAAAALQAARGRRRATLRLHPAAAAALRSEAGPLASLAGLAAQPGQPGQPVLELVPDPALDPGDVVVETEAGVVDGRLSVRLEAMRRALLEAA
jgi:type III secretion protein L